MAEAEAKLHTIKCTQCAAPLTLKGGHQVRSITCGYCGSVLDTKEEFKVVKQYLDRKRPPSVLELGMTGKIHGVEFTIIGVVQFQDDEYARWLEFLLFSPTHGYAWLEDDAGHFIFTRRVRDLPDKPVSAQRKSSFKARRHTFKVLEEYTISISYVEGELTWVAEVGDKVRLLDAIDPPFIYTVEKTGTEEEYSIGEYLQPEAVHEAFSIDFEPKKRYTVHPAQPYIPNPMLVAMSQAGKYFAPLALVIVIYAFFFGSGETLLRGSVTPVQFIAGAQSAPFEVKNKDSLLALHLSSPLKNAWAWFDVTVRNEQREIFSLSKQISYYSGYSGGEHWSEGSQSTRAYFKVPAAGKYTLLVTGEGGTGSRGTKPQQKALNVTVKEGVIVSRYFVILLALTMTAFLWRYIMRWRFEARRWETDEDDDD
ncbi:MAG: hypothetical protein DRQ37_04355 [Gammaproteobacteria bacterium]|nr:MAG: hypothetical protein DRQ37_04355 [Gammaproteobacteria bacterium]